MSILTDREIYDLVRASGLAKNQYEFSQLCGRSKSWFSGITTRRREMNCKTLAWFGTKVDAASEHLDSAPLANLYTMIVNETHRRWRQQQQLRSAPTTRSLSFSSNPN